MRPVYRDEPCRTALNRVRKMSFNWSLNPYMGCVHQCTFCFVRAFERMADRPSDARYGTSIRVKTNLVEVLRRELARRSWKREQVVVGTATDPYQPAEGHYRLTRGAISALGEARTPIEIITRGPLIVRDVEVLAEASRHAKVGVTFSIPTLDPEIWRLTEPGTAPPGQRLRALRALIDAGIDASVGMAPILPGLSDDPAKMADVVRAARDAGATSVWTNVLYLRPGTREHFLESLARDWPDLLPLYARLYDGRAFVTKETLEPVRRQVRELARRHGLADRRRRPITPLPEPDERAVAADRVPPGTGRPARVRRCLRLGLVSPGCGQRGRPGAERGRASQSARTGEKMSTTTAPSGPATASWARFDGIRHVPPGPSSRRSPSTVNVMLPSRHMPSCSCS